MAGYRLTLKKLAKKYGVDIKGLTYTQLIHEIIDDNVVRASKKMGEISNRRMKKAFEEAISDGIIELPAYAVPNVTLRKSAEDGKIITDTLRDTLTRGLRKAILDNPNDVEKAMAQMQQSITDTMNGYKSSHAKMIAVTEVRSAVDLSKYAYVEQMLARNPNKLIVTKKWIHHDHLVKLPRPMHKAIDGQVVPFNQPFSIGLMYPHDPNAPASEVINCQCGYQINVEERATNEIFKELKANLTAWVFKAKAGINPATGAPWKIGDTKVRPDGTKWVKTGTFSWAKAGTEDAKEAQERDTNDDGKVDNKDKKPDWYDEDSASLAMDKMKSYGKTGIRTMTKGELLNLLYANGVDNPKAMSWQEKMSKYEELVAEMEKNTDNSIQIKTQGKQEFTEEDFHILHNSGLQADYSALENDTVNTRNGSVTLKFTEDGHLTDECYDELKANIDPIEGGHWGSASTRNSTALAVALVNAPDWKPIDKMKDGNLAVYDQELADYQYRSALVEGIGLRKYAQKKLKHPDMSRERIPNFYRGMSISAEQYEQILAGEVDTIELTGCTAVTSFEEVADHYATSSWTANFGSGRRSIKLVIERDDYMDNSIGMFHPNHKGYAHGNRNIGFELLTGSPSFYIKSVGAGKDKEWSVDKSTEEFGDLIKNGWNGDSLSDDTKEKYNVIKDADPSDFFDNNVYIVKFPDGSDHHEYSYKRMVEYMNKLKAKAEMVDLNKRVFEWEKQYYKDHANDYFSKIKNNKFDHANNRQIHQDWETDIDNAFKKSDLYKEWIGILNAEHEDPNWSDTYRGFSSDNTPEDSEKEEINKYFDNPKIQNQYKRDALLSPRSDLQNWRMETLYNKWRDMRPTKKTSLTFRVFLDKRKPLEKMYKTQADKTQKEYDNFKAYYDWRNKVFDSKRFDEVTEKSVKEILKKYNLPEDKWDNVFHKRDGGGIYFSPWSVPYGVLDRDTQRNLEQELSSLYYSKPQLTSDGMMVRTTYLAEKDNPYLTPEMRNSPFWERAKSGGFSDKRYEQLSSIRDKYENAKRENELMQKYDMTHTSYDTMKKKYEESNDKCNEANKNLNTYLAEKWLDSLGDKVSDHIKETWKEDIINGKSYRITDSLQGNFEEYKENLKNSDKEYKKLDKAKLDADTVNGELTQAVSVYRDYNNKLAESHKSSKPLEVHVVCGRGKSAMTGGDDTLEGEEDGSDQ